MNFLSLSEATPSAVYFQYRITILTRFVLFVLLKRYFFVVVVCGGFIFLLFVAPGLLAVFAASDYSTTMFNQDVSKWNTGAVIIMQDSKCTISPSLCGHAFRCCVF